MKTQDGGKNFYDNNDYNEKCMSSESVDDDDAENDSDGAVKMEPIKNRKFEPTKENV
jgi:hypothetical protein